MTRLYTEDECRTVAAIVAANAVNAVETKSGESLQAIVDRALSTAIPSQRSKPLPAVGAPMTNPRDRLDEVERLLASAEGVDTATATRGLAEALQTLAAEVRQIRYELQMGGLYR